MLPGGDFPTFVRKVDNGDGDGYIQLRLHAASPHAHVLFISPCDGLVEIPDIGDDEPSIGSEQAAVWLELLDDAVAEAGARGIHHVVAEIDEHAPGLPILRRAGFAVYTRQDIWGADKSRYRPQSKSKALTLEPRTPADDWDVQLLYANTVPRLVQLVEPIPPVGEGEDWILRNESEIGAVVHIHRGDLATWLRLFIHPDAEAVADGIVSRALALAFEKDAEQVYCCVRRYESWPSAVLERRGLTIIGSQAVMVRHTVHHASRPQTETVARVEGQTVTASSRFVRRYKQTGNHEEPSNG